MKLSDAIRKAKRISINLYLGEESVSLDISKAKARQAMTADVNYLDAEFDGNGCIQHAESGAIIALLSDEGTLAGYPENGNFVLLLGI